MSTIFTLNHILNYSLKVVRKTPAIVVSLRMTESEGTKATVEQSLLPTEGTTSSVTVQKTTEGTGDVPVMDSTAAPEKTQATSSKRTKRSKSSRKNT